LRNVYLDSLRGIFSIWVFVSHIFSINNINFIVFNQPGYAVDGFIFLSGYFINLSLKKLILNNNQNNSIKIFFLQRFFRIWPTYAIILLLIFIYSKIVNTYQFNNITIPIISTKTFLINLFLLNGIFPKYISSTLIPSWSLSLETQYYFIIPFIYFLNFQKNYIFITIIFLITLLSPIFLGNYGKSGVFLNFGLPSLLTFKIFYFFIGALWQDTIDDISNKKLLLFCILITYFINIYTAFVLTIIFSSFYSNLLKKVFFIFKSIYFKFLAKISYSLYLIHSPIIYIIFKSSFFRTNSFIPNFYITSLKTILTILITITCSWFLTTKIEIPLYNFGKKLSKYLTS
jgi:peptidoglycan/LPS O-acetylase OafA/YrhL